MNRKFLTESLPIFILPYCILASTAGSASGHSLGNGLESDTDSLRQPTKAGIVLKDVVVEGNGYSKDMQMRSALSTTYVGKQFIETNFSGSLMQSLEKIPGVKAMSVGSNESKPTIRGLGFNRVVVAENGIKHEGQQWGDDHGLEIDQYDIDHAEVIKGPASLSYGSDAIGGVINLTSTAVPQDRFKWSANLFARSVNDAIGTSVRLTGRKNNFWYKANATFIDYADQRVPVDSIQYYSYYIKLHNRRLRNTSGRETYGSLTIGHTGNKWSSWLRISDVNTKSGFFANAHGLEVRLSEIDYDRSARDVDLPQHSVNHLFVSNHTEWHWKGGLAESNISWQNNHQRELSEPVSHGYMPKPDGTLEHSFDKNTVSAAVNVKQTIGTNSLKGGVNAEYQHNRSGGWSFVLPDFELLQFGIFLSDHFAVNDNIILSTGIRFDYGSINTHSYHDWFKTPTASGDSIYAERSANLHRAFNSVTWSAGIDNHIGNLVLKVNIGKSFRMPIAKELGIDGVNYSIFRYEKGNANLNPEESYQLDAAAVYSHDGIKASVTPFFNYFPNYIYLCPTSEYKEGLQLYNYEQSRVARCGFEAELSFLILQHFKISAGGEYLYARQLSGDKKGYSLPFSTPWSVRVQLRYDLPAADDAKGGFAAVEYVAVGRQNEIVPPEEPTPGHQLINISVGKSLKIGGARLRLSLRCDNLLNNRYYDHTSHYRLIDVPEPGRNFSFMATWEI